MDFYIKAFEQIQNYYINLLIVQYHNKPKARETIRLIIGLIYANMILLQIRDAFDWRTAKGVQQDIIGAWEGVTRFYNGQLFDFHPWFSLIDWDSKPDNLQGGFSTFETFDSLEGGFLDYEEILPTQNKLNDTAFTIMIGLKIIKNHINHTAKNIDNAIWDYFEGKVYTTWENKTLTYHYPSELREVLQVAESKKVLPVPTGVKIILKEIIENG